MFQHDQVDDDQTSVGDEQPQEVSVHQAHGLMQLPVGIGLTRHTIIHDVTSKYLMLLYFRLHR